MESWPSSCCRPRSARTRSSPLPADRGEPMSRSVADCTVLVVGLGAVGRAVVARLRPFGPRIVAVRAHPERGVGAGVEQVVGTCDLVGAVGQADVVIRAAVLDADSRGLFDARVFRSFEPGAVFINVARGAPPTSSAGSPANPRSGRPTRPATN
ncbi:MAG TPA: NAD(P)-dependent oxidoreductase, partial [Pseudonocardia sp.]